jgi:hypothetical protein
LACSTACHISWSSLVDGWERFGKELKILRLQLSRTESTSRIFLVHAHNPLSGIGGSGYRKQRSSFPEVAVKDCRQAQLCIRAIDTTLCAISCRIVHSRVGVCDPRGLFAKRVLHGDSHHALAIASLRYLIPKNMIYDCTTRFHSRVLKNLSGHAQLLVPSWGSFMFLTSGKRGQILGLCHKLTAAFFRRERRPYARTFFFASPLRYLQSPLSLQERQVQNHDIRPAV